MNSVQASMHGKRKMHRYKTQAGVPYRRIMRVGECACLATAVVCGVGRSHTPPVNLLLYLRRACAARVCAQSEGR